MSNTGSDILLFLLVFIVAIIVGGLHYITDCIGKCRHKWDDWHDESTEDAYVQFRTCIKCGYRQREQWKKIKENT